MKKEKLMPASAPKPMAQTKGHGHQIQIHIMPSRPIEPVDDNMVGESDEVDPNMKMKSVKDIKKMANALAMNKVKKPRG